MAQGGNQQRIYCEFAGALSLAALMKIGKHSK